MPSEWQHHPPPRRISRRVSRRVSITNKLGQTTVAGNPAASGGIDLATARGLGGGRSSLVGGVRTRDGRRRSCVGVPPQGGGGGGLRRCSIGPVREAELVRRREMREAAERGRRASLLAQARVQETPPRGPADGEAATDGSDDEEDALILQAVAIMSGEGTAGRPPANAKPGSGSGNVSPSVQPKKDEDKKNSTVKQKKEKKRVQKRISDFSIMDDSSDDGSNTTGDEWKVGAECEILQKRDLVHQDQSAAASAAKDAYRLAMEQERAALAEAHKALQFGKNNSTEQQQRQPMRGKKQQGGRGYSKGTMTPSQMEECEPLPPKLWAVAQSGREEKDSHDGTPAVQLVEESSFLSPELSRHRARVEEARRSEQAKLEGLTLEEHKRLLMQRFGGTQASSAVSAPGSFQSATGPKPHQQKHQQPPLLSPPQQQGLRAPAMEPTPPRKEEPPVSSELARHRARVEEAERRQQASCEEMTLDQHKKLLHHRFGTSAADPNPLSPSPKKFLVQPQPNQQSQKPSAKEITLEQHKKMLQQRFSMPNHATAPPLQPRHQLMQPLPPDPQRISNPKPPDLTDGINDAKAPPASAPRQDLFANRGGTRRSSPRTSPPTPQRQCRRISLTRMDSRDEAVMSVGNRWRKSADVMRTGDHPNRWSDSSEEADAGKELDGARTRALRAVVKSRSCVDGGKSWEKRSAAVGGGKNYRKSCGVFLSAGDPLLEALDILTDEEDGGSPVLSSSDPSDEFLLDNFAGPPNAAVDAGEAASQQPAPNASPTEESTLSILSFPPPVARRSASDSASLLDVTSSITSATADPLPRRHSGGGRNEENADVRQWQWEHPLGYEDALSFVSALGNEWERAAHAFRRRRRGEREPRHGKEEAAVLDRGGKSNCKRHVQFLLTGGQPVEVQPIPHIIDLSDRERAGTWRNDSDREATRDDVLVAMMSIRNGDGIRCTRGLEQLASDEEWELRRINRDFVITAVLEEQREQRLIGRGMDEEKIAEASRVRSEIMVEAAVDAAVADAQFAKEIARDPSYQSSDSNSPAQAVKSGREARPTHLQSGGSALPLFGETWEGLGGFVQRLTQEKYDSKLNEGSLICDFQRQSRHFFARMRPTAERPTVRPSAA